MKLVCSYCQKELEREITPLSVLVRCDGCNRYSCIDDENGIKLVEATGPNLVELNRVQTTAQKEKE